MHELALSENLISNALMHAEDKPISGMTLQVGLLSCVDPNALVHCFDAIKTQYTQLTETKLNIVVCYPTAKCLDCHRLFQVKELGQPCRCGSFNFSLSGGEELMISMLEFESHNLAS